ncbi:hypothetical protein L1049_027165 [Liquidambar formosana]|uniref:Inositol polyphosphate-related phosphatase domain-containing protein n=1 Tax=Liquidambar formosana TaxID=63359 RepID=A0AAP0N711_LIQFO
MVGMAKNIRLKRIFSIDSDSRLDWPERSLDSMPKVFSSGSKLRRVLSSSARMGFELTENPLVLSPQNFALGGSRLKRVHYSSGNLGLMWMEQQEGPEVLDSVPVVSDRISDDEDDSFLEIPETQYDNGVIKGSGKVHPRYVRIVSKQMVGIYISVWVRRTLRRHINNLKVSPVGVGLMGYMGNKIFWFGDLNYRLNMLDTELSKGLRSGHVFDGWKEGLINFPPTYKYEIDSDRYVGENLKEGETKRSPAWCDRILWLGKGIKQLSYGRAEKRLSDHRPVSSTFLLEVEVFDHRKLQKVLNFTTAAVYPEIFLDEEGDLNLSR